MAADSEKARRRTRRVVRWSLGAALVLAAYGGCGFPEHDFIPDDEFDQPDASVGGGAAQAGSGGSAGNAATGGAGGTAGGTGSGGGSGSAGASGGMGGTGGSSATGGAGGASGGTGASGGSGGGPTENCTNGTDDDSDSRVDCADDDCTDLGFQCAAKPADWLGPVALYVGPTASAPPGCGGAYPTIGFNLNRTLNAPPAVCSQCQCDTPAGATCTTPELSFWPMAACTGSGLRINDVSPVGTCYYVNLTPDAGPFVPTSAQAINYGPQGGSCNATGGALVNTPPYAWVERGRACGEPSGGSTAAGCGSNLCVAPAPAGFNQGTCIHKTGNVSCPSPFTTKVVLHGDVTDGRGCAGCGCNGPTGVQCKGKIDIWNNNMNCSGTASATLTSLDGTQCVNVDSTTTKAFRWTNDVGYPQGGSCTSNGGGPSGTATPADPTTFCCL